MARPIKWRKVCCMPGCNRFGPLDNTANENHIVTMAVDEYETIRLIDLEGFTQEDCAMQMNVARTTVQRIYSDARRKLAESLVNGIMLRVEGGEFELCDGLSQCSHGCERNSCPKQVPL